MKKILALLLIVFLGCTLVSAKELKGFGFESFSEKAKFYKLQFEGEEDGGKLIIESDLKFVAKGKTGTKENIKKMEFELFDPDSSINEEMDKKGIKLKNVKVGTLVLEPVPDFDSKFTGTLKLNKKIEGINGELKVFLAIFGDEKE
ncbi:hypothetical protein KAJ27_09440 [bacterium]|nr:hypothetical protein [bacterium]